MANYNLTNQTISSSFQQLLQKDADTGNLVNGLGEVVDDLIVTASYATTASYAENVVDPTWDNITDKPTVVSGSSQIDYPLISNIPSGIISSSEQLPSGVVSGSSQVDYPLISNIPSGIISSSEQLPSGIISGSTQVSYPELSNIPSGIVSSSEQLPSGVVSGSSQVSYPELSNIPSGIVSASSQVVLQDTTGDLSGSRIDGEVSLSTTSSYALSAEADNVTFDDTQFAYTASNVQIALQRLSDNKADISQLTSNINVYPTNAASDVSGYFALVSSSADVRYNDTAVDIPTGTISGSNQFIAALITDSYLFTGDPGIVNITTIGQVRRTSGGNNSSADFYYEIYKRSGSVETLIVTSDTTSDVNVESYQEFSATAILNNTTFTTDDRIVIKYYGNLVDPAGAAPSFDFQFGGENPVRTLFPVPASVLVSPWDGQFTGDATITGTLNVTDSFTSSLQEGYAWVGDSNNKNIQVATSSFGGGSTIDTGSFATTGSNTFNGDETINGTNLAPGSTFTVKDGNSTNRIDVANATLAGLTGTDIILNGTILNDGDLNVTGNISGTILANNNVVSGSSQIDVTQTTNIDTLATTGSNTFTGDQTINGTNTIPGNTFTANDGNGTSRISVSNATLSGIIGTDVVVNGNTLLDGTVAIDGATRINGNLENTGSFTNGGDTTIVGTNLAPGSTFTVKDGNNTPRIDVSNATLGGLTGVDVVINGNTTLDGDSTNTGKLSVEGELQVTGSVTLGRSGASNNVFLYGNQIYVSGNQPFQVENGIQLNSGNLQVVNGFIYNDGAFYRGVQTYNPTTNAGVTLDGQVGDYFIVNLPAGGNTTIDMSSYDQGRTFSIKIVQNSTTAATVTLASKFKTIGGSGYTASTGLGAVDILDVRHYDSSPQDLYVVGIGKDFS